MWNGVVIGYMKTVLLMDMRTGVGTGHGMVRGCRDGSETRPYTRIPRPYSRTSRPYPYIPSLHPYTPSIFPYIPSIYPYITSLHPIFPLNIPDIPSLHPLIPPLQHLFIIYFFHYSIFWGYLLYNCVLYLIHIHFLLCDRRNVIAI